MIELFYTNSVAPLGAQPVPDFSVGNYISSSKIPNDYLSNLFSPISQLSKQFLKRETVLIALKNNFDYDISLLLDFTISSNSICKYYVAFIAPNVDDCNNLYFEKIKTTEGKPIYADFQEITFIDSDFDLSILQSKKYIGIWLMREINKDLVAPKSCEEVIAQTSDDLDINREESLIMSITYENADTSSSNSNSSSVSAS